MSLVRVAMLAWLCASLVSAAGCQYVPASRLSSCESQNRILAEQARAQLADVAAVRERNRQLEDQLAATEKQLAMLDSGAGPARVSNSTADNLASGARVAVPRPAVAGPGASSQPTDQQLAALAAKHANLEYDATTGTCRLGSEVLFDSGQMTISDASEQMLEDFARVMRSGEAAALRVLVVGHTDAQQITRRPTREQFLDNWHLSAARAVVVADHLRRFGLDEDRLAVAGMGRNQPLAANDSAGGRKANRRVEIYVLSQETPLVGWNVSPAPRY